MPESRSLHHGQSVPCPRFYNEGLRETKLILGARIEYRQLIRRSVQDFTPRQVLNISTSSHYAASEIRLY